MIPWNHVTGQKPIEERSDRRCKPRTEGPVAARVRGTDNCGETFEIAVVVENLSASGLYMVTSQRLEPGTTLWVSIRLSPSGVIHEDVARVGLQGVVRRAELRSDGLCGFGVAFTNYHIFQAV